MELPEEVLWRLHSPRYSQVFVESAEVSGRSGVVIGRLDKICSESVPTDKAFTSNMFSRSKALFFLKCSQHSATFLGGIQPRIGAKIFLISCFFSYFSSRTMFPQIPPMFFKPSGHLFTFFQAVKLH